MRAKKDHSLSTLLSVKVFEPGYFHSLSLLLAFALSPCVCTCEVLFKQWAVNMWDLLVIVSLWKPPTQNY